MQKKEDDKPKTMRIIRREQKTEPKEGLEDKKVKEKVEEKNLPIRGLTNHIDGKTEATFIKKLFDGNEKEYKRGAEPFYTNSTHLPVNFSDDIFEVLELQDPLQTRYTGGTVLHGFVGEKINNVEGLKSLIRTICARYRLPYFTITPTFSICPFCGYIAGEHRFCTKCENQCEVYSRVVGYLRPQVFNGELQVMPERGRRT